MALNLLPHLAWTFPPESARIPAVPLLAGWTRIELSLWSAPRQLRAPTSVSIRSGATWLPRRSVRFSSLSAFSSVDFFARWNRGFSGGALRQPPGIPGRTTPRGPAARSASRLRTVRFRAVCRRSIRARSRRTRSRRPRTCRRHGRPSHQRTLASRSPPRSRRAGPRAFELRWRRALKNSPQIEPT